MIQFIQSIRGKVFLMVLPPILALTALATFHAVDRLATLTKVNHLARMSELATAVGNATHSLQAERGAAAMYLSSPSPEREQVMRSFRKAGQIPLESMERALQSDLPSLDSDLASRAKILLPIEDLRQRVDTLGVTPREALEAYGTQIRGLLELHQGLLKSSVGTALESRLRALSTLQDLKEQAGLEGATVGSALSLGSFPPGFFEGSLGQRGAQQVLTHSLSELVDPSERPELEALLHGPGTRELDELRHQADAVSRNGSLTGNPVRWFQVTSARMSALKDFETKLSASLLAQTRSLRSHAVRDLVLVLLGTLALQILLVAGAWGLSRHITRPMEHLATAMTRLQAGDLTQELPVQGGDEISHMTLAFNQMSARLRSLHAQLLKAAKELAEGSRTLMLNAERVNGATIQLAQGALQQREHTDHMTGAAYALSASIEQVRRQMEEALEKTSQVRTLAERGGLASASQGSDAELFGRAFRAILGIVQEVDLKAADIHLATEDQARCNRTVSDRVGEVSQKAGQTLQTASQLANAAPEVLYTAKGLHHLAEGLAESAAAFQV